MSNIVYMDKDMIIRENGIGDYSVTERLTQMHYRWYSSFVLDNEEIINQSKWVISEARKRPEYLLDEYEKLPPSTTSNICDHCMGTGRLK